MSDEWLKLGTEAVVYSAKEYKEGKWLHCPWLSALELTGDEWIVSMPSPPFALGGIDAIFLEKEKADRYVQLCQENERLKQELSQCKEAYKQDACITGDATGWEAKYLDTCHALDELQQENERLKKDNGVYELSLISDALLGCRNASTQQMLDEIKELRNQLSRAIQFIQDCDDDKATLFLKNMEIQETKLLVSENESLKKQVVDLRGALEQAVSWLELRRVKDSDSFIHFGGQKVLFAQLKAALATTADPVSTSNTSDAVQTPTDLSGKVLVDREQWQPIETAPKDGTEILAALDCTGWVGLVTWGNGCWYETAAPDPAEPTHWQPLPEPPKQEALGEESK